MKIEYKFTEDGIKDAMKVVGETYKLGSAPTNTGRGKRLFAQMIPDNYKDLANKVIDRCKYQYSHNTYEVSMSADEIAVLRYLVDYVMAL